MAQFGSIITNIGLAKIANAQITHDTVDIESMVLGDGNGAYYTVSQNQTALRNEVWRGLLSDQRIDPSNPNRIEFSAFIPSSVGGFTIREVGLLDTEGNLIALSLYPEQYKPTLGEGISDDILIHFVIETSNASVITLAVDVTNVIATRQYVDEKTAEVNNALTEHSEDSKKYAIVNNTVAQSIPNNTSTQMLFNNITHKNGAAFINLSSGRINVLQKGIYEVLVFGHFEISANGFRQIQAHNSNAVVSTQSAGIDVPTRLIASTKAEISAETLLNLPVYQTSGGALDLLSVSQVVITKVADLI